MNENSLKNLEKGIATRFNGDTAVIAQAKSAVKRKENKLLKEVASEKLLKKFNGVSFQDLTLDKLLEYCKIQADKNQTKMWQLLICR